jgi:hypothetical protein
VLTQILHVQDYYKCINIGLESVKWLFKKLKSTLVIGGKLKVWHVSVLLVLQVELWQPGMKSSIVPPHVHG